MGAKIEVNVVPEKFLIRVWESVHGAVAGIASPWQIRREGKARTEVRRNEALVDAQTKRDVDAILSGTAAISSKLLASPIERLALPPTSELSTCPVSPEQVSRHAVPSTPAELQELSNLHMRVDALEKLLNLRAVHRSAEDVIESEYPHHEPPEARPSRDWLTAWRNGAEAVSDEDLQRLWARLLCGEVIKPGSYSRRAIEALKLLSYKEAKILSKIAPHVLGGAIFKTKTNSDENKTGLERAYIDGVSFSEFLDLENAGLFQGVEGLLAKTIQSFELSSGLHGLILSTVSDVYLLITFKSIVEITLGAMLVSPVGLELVRLGNFQPDEVSIMRFVDDVRRVVGKKEIRVSLVNLVEADSNRKRIEEVKCLRSSSEDMPD